MYVAQAPAWTVDALWPLVGPVAQALFLWTALVVAGRVAYLVGAKGAWLALVWLVKLVTDPVTDILAYSPRYLAAPKAMFASRGRNGGSR